MDWQYPIHLYGRPFLPVRAEHGDTRRMSLYTERGIQWSARVDDG